MVSNRCIVCDINWFPYQSNEGRCPECGGGTVIRQEPASPQAVARYRAVMYAGEKSRLHAEFEKYYAAREARRLAGEQDTENAEAA